MLELLNQITELVQGTLDSPWLWLVIFAVSGLDALLPFMPSEMTVVTVAVLLGPAPLQLALLAVVAATGALAGDLISHLVGRRAGPRAVRLLRRGTRGQARHDWACRMLRRHAITVILAGRYVPGGRVAVGLATGSLRYPIGRFAAFDALGTSIWATYCAVIGLVGWRGFAGEPGKGLLLAFGVGAAILFVTETGRRMVSRPNDHEDNHPDRHHLHRIG